MPTIYRKNGYRFFFYSNEGSEPPHIHIIGHGGEAKIWLQTAEFAFDYNINPAQRRWLKAQVKQHVLEFMEKWNDVFKHG